MIIKIISDSLDDDCCGKEIDSIDGLICDAEKIAKTFFFDSCVKEAKFVFETPIGNFKYSCKKFDDVESVRIVMQAGERYDTSAYRCQYDEVPHNSENLYDLTVDGKYHARDYTEACEIARVLFYKQFGKNPAKKVNAVISSEKINGIVNIVNLTAADVLDNIRPLLGIKQYSLMDMTEWGMIDDRSYDCYCLCEDSGSAKLNERYPCIILSDIYKLFTGIGMDKIKIFYHDPLSRKISLYIDEHAHEELFPELIADRPVDGFPPDLFFSCINYNTDTFITNDIGSACRFLSEGLYNSLLCNAYGQKMARMSDGTIVIRDAFLRESGVLMSMMSDKSALNASNSYKKHGFGFSEEFLSFAATEIISNHAQCQLYYRY